MKIRLHLLGLLSLAIMLLSVPALADAKTDVAKNFLVAVSESNYAAVWNTLSVKVKKVFIEEASKEFSVTAEEAEKQFASGKGEIPALVWEDFKEELNINVKNLVLDVDRVEIMNGEEAVIIKDDGENVELPVVKENGGWYVTFPLDEL